MINNLRSIIPAAYPHPFARREAEDGRPAFVEGDGSAA